TLLLGRRRPVYRKHRPVWPLSNDGGRPYTLRRPDAAWRRAAMATKRTTTKQSAAKPADPTAELLTTTELIAQAKKRLSAESWDFVCGGAETETTLLRNRHSLDGIAFRPRVLRNVEGASAATTFLKHKQRLPVLLAPVASLTDIDPEGALPIARAAAEFGCLMLASSVTQPGFEEIARAAREQFAFQIYPDGDERWVLDTVKRAVGAGAKAICLTVDVPTFGR